MCGHSLLPMMMYWQYCIVYENWKICLAQLNLPVETCSTKSNKFTNSYFLYLLYEPYAGISLLHTKCLKQLILLNLFKNRGMSINFVFIQFSPIKLPIWRKSQFFCLGSIRTLFTSHSFYSNKFLRWLNNVIM